MFFRCTFLWSYMPYMAALIAHMSAASFSRCVFLICVAMVLWSKSCSSTLTSRLSMAYKWTPSRPVTAGSKSVPHGWNIHTLVHSANEHVTTIKKMIKCTEMNGYAHLCASVPLHCSLHIRAVFYWPHLRLIKESCRKPAHTVVNTWINSDRLTGSCALMHL